MKETIQIQEDFITLGQVLKEVGIIGTGGAAKWYLQENPVHVNNEEENRRGRKLFPGDQVQIENFGLVLIKEG
ncbi:S4 domain-containing protein YaaA [Evansella tamaricis]|uniref:S4 domain-containing protein YaaA n=1 Tax=Evansella tamaricis TaxID=2069301 RepID=A0ABS6JA95_9BACI|nr:S4 domain-containing protein YaaA [Evansella tamaricis]MBU9710608.1 S4 domain-containing protein YaaA [Evansella tamaricis]